VTTFATTHQAPRPAELEERVRRAWSAYRENLAELDGVAYDEAERAEWEYLQVELREIATERAAARDGAAERASP